MVNNPVESSSRQFYSRIQVLNGTLLDGHEDPDIPGSWIRRLYTLTPPLRDGEWFAAYDMTDRNLLHVPIGNIDIVDVRIGSETPESVAYAQGYKRGWGRRLPMKQLDNKSSAYLEGYYDALSQKNKLNNKA